MSARSTLRGLPDTPLDIIGDVHGELGALHSLLKKLGYDDRGQHTDGRRLVFVGDLVDRGPDSPGVLRAVMRMVEAGNVQCVIGNHELNALRDDSRKRREGEGWWYGREEPGFASVLVSEEEKQRSFLPFLRGLPAALERRDLRVVHACWHDESIASLRERECVIDFYREREAARKAELRSMEEKASAACRLLGLESGDLRDVDKEVPLVPALAEYETANQMGNAVRVVTSGAEQPARDTFYSSGKWRMVERVTWWDEYAGTPVVVGHYWRQYYADQTVRGKESVKDLFRGVAADQWLGREGRVMCIDYSIGKRYAELAEGTPENELLGCLAALRVPEWQLVFNDGRAPLSIAHPR